MNIPPNTSSHPSATAPASVSSPRPSLASLPQAEPFFSPALAAHRATLAAHRATAFIRYVPTVAGLRLRPVSLRSLERLAAFECDLALGRFEDLAVFVWVHHPAFGQFSALRRWLVLAHLRHVLTPAWPRLASFLGFASVLFTASGGLRAQLLGRPFAAARWLVTCGRPTTSEARLGQALGEARALLTRARTDWPAADDSGTASALPCAFAAYVLNLVKGRHPALGADEIMDWPLVELVQWLRAIVHEANPKGALLDSTEAALIAAELSPDHAPAKEGA